MGSFVYHDQDGVQRTMLFDDADPDTCVVKTSMDIEKLIDNNREFADMHPTGTANKLLARIPMTVYETSIHENWGDDDWKKWLNDPQNKPFRIWPGRV